MQKTLCWICFLMRYLEMANLNLDLLKIGMVNDMYEEVEMIVIMILLSSQDYYEKILFAKAKKKALLFWRNAL